jgi:hypothetical protein
MVASFGRTGHFHTRSADARSIKVSPTMALDTNLVREEPGLPDAESLAADPRY